MPSAYRVAPLFLIRLAGVPFDALGRLATTRASEAARQFLGQEVEFLAAQKAAQEFVTRRDNGLSPSDFHAWRNALQRGDVPAGLSVPAPLAEYARVAGSRRKTEQEISSELAQETESARKELYAGAQKFLPDYLVFASADARRLLQAAPENRNSRVRERERHLLLYLQRVAAKNDTFGRFGPSSWGRSVPDAQGVTFSSANQITDRDVFLERWTAHAFAAAINRDPEAAEELSPRLNPNGALAGNRFIFTDQGASVEVKDPARLAELDGLTPRHALKMDAGSLSDLIDQKVIISALEVPALEPHAFEVLCADVSGWRAGLARARWWPRMEMLSEKVRQFSSATEEERRVEIVEDIRSELGSLGAERKAGQRSLYAATNPIAEECFRETGFVVNEGMLNEVARDAAIWLDFWRDTYAFVASRVSSVLARVFAQIPKQDDGVPLPAFLRACELSKIPLASIGLVGPAHLAFQEVKTAFRARIQPHAADEEYELTTEDCHVVRDQFQYPKFDEFTFPSLDLQLSARSLENIARGRYRWILSEVHPPPALLHHCMFWRCPDQKELGRALAQVSGKSFHFGFAAADFTAHTTVRAFDALPETSTFVASQRANSAWRQVLPGHAQVYQSEDDIRLRHAVTHEDLGSFARNWVISLGFHPFQFGMAPQMPRLRCGRIIVQRRSWTVAANELGSGNFSGISHDLVVAVERLREKKGWPRHVYIRPSEQALRRSGAEGRDKDTKPVYIDLESYLFLEIFHRWLVKSGELEVTEMLPAPEDLWWQEEGGARTCELRTLILPA